MLTSPLLYYHLQSQAHDPHRLLLQAKTAFLQVRIYLSLFGRLPVIHTITVSGGGNINKISKLIGHQTISTTEAVEHSKLAKLLGANVKEAAEQIPITLSSAKPSAAVKHAVEASALEPHKLLKRGKQPTRFPLSIVPQKLDTNLNSMHQIEILRGGYVVAQYKNTGMWRPYS
jgi:hypothetical protein